MEIKKYEKKMDLSFLQFRFNEYTRAMRKKYSNFHTWFNKISQKIGSKQRIVYLVFETFKTEKKIIGIMILKNTNMEKKICSIYVSEKYRNKGIGKQLFEIAFKELGTRLPVISLPEKNYNNEFKALLDKYKFRFTRKENFNNRRCEYYFNERVKLLLSIKPKYANKIFDGSKKYELRKNIWKFGTQNIVVVYSSEKVKKVIGEFLTTEVIIDSPEKIWCNYKDELGIDEKSFFDYYKGKKRAFAIKIDEVIKYDKPFELSKIRKIRAPQTYMYQDKYKTEFEKREDKKE